MGGSVLSRVILDNPLAPLGELSVSHIFCWTPGGGDAVNVN
jgi:hypothetical protein